MERVVKIPLDKVLDRFVQYTPVSVMHRVLLKNLLSMEKLDRIFQDHSQVQYERELLFSTLVDLTPQVVGRVTPSTRAAYLAIREQINVSLTSIYNKLQRIEIQTSEGLTRQISSNVVQLIDNCKGTCQPLLNGCRVRILDGNHLGKTNYRIKALRNTAAGA